MTQENKLVNLKRQNVTLYILVQTLSKFLLNAITHSKIIIRKIRLSISIYSSQHT